MNGSFFPALNLIRDQQPRTRDQRPLQERRDIRAAGADRKSLCMRLNGILVPRYGYDPSVHYHQVRDSCFGVRTPDGR